MKYYKCFFRLEKDSFLIRKQIESVLKNDFIKKGALVLKLEKKTISFLKDKERQYQQAVRDHRFSPLKKKSFVVDSGYLIAYFLLPTSFLKLIPVYIQHGIVSKVVLLGK